MPFGYFRRAMSSENKTNYFFKGENTMLKTCKKCSGKGSIPMLGHNLPCPVCQKLGKVDVPDGMDICDNCKGSGGTHTATGKLPCLVCKGTGFVPDPATKKDD